MSTQIVPFDFDGAQVRVVTIDDEPWFVLADLCTVLEIANVGNVAARLDPLSIRQADVQNARGQMRATVVVSEAGMYEVVIRSDKPDAARFRRWITAEVLPQIRRTGSYGTPALTGPELLARAVIEAQAMIQAREAEVAELTPRAEAWDALAATDGDYSMRDAAQILCRDHGVDIGQNRLSKRLREIGWVDPQGIPYQRHVDLGRIRSRARHYTHARTQERVLAEPQIRITPKGVADLRTILATKEIA